MKKITHIPNGSRYEENGWIRASVRGTPHQIGLAHGELLAKEIAAALVNMDFVAMDSYGYKATDLANVFYDIFTPRIQEGFPDLMTEIEGIAQGCKKAGHDVGIKKIFLWNCWYSVGYVMGSLHDIIMSDHKLKEKYGHLFPAGAKSLAQEGGAKDKCSAFIAVGDWTTDGKIVCAHNTFDNFVDAQFCNIMLSIKPNKGNSFIMQTSPGQVCSGTDYYVSGNGFIVTETTIGGFNQYAMGDPIFARIRQAVQFANSIDDYLEMLQKNNSGDYANSWLIGDTNTNEIARIELGLHYVNVERKKNGFFIGFNAPYDGRIRNLECVNTGFYDIRRHQGARRVRLGQFMQQYKGKLNVEVGQRILGDHYDIYLNKVNPCSRTVCSHYNLDQREYMSQADRPFPYQPRGAMDGIVSSTGLAKQMGLTCRWGSSCGTPFYAKEFCKRNQQWANFEKYLIDRPHQPWTIFIGKRRHRKTRKINK
jgi:hypothetical protein